jgi:hypothetical protein
LVKQNSPPPPPAKKKKTLTGIKQGTFLITTTPFVGLMATVLSRGIIPEDSLLGNFVEAVAFVVLRLMTFLTARVFQTTTCQHSSKVQQQSLETHPKFWP